MKEYLLVQLQLIVLVHWNKIIYVLQARSKINIYNHSITYGSAPSPNIKCGFLLARSNINCAKTLFAPVKRYQMGCQTHSCKIVRKKTQGKQLKPQQGLTSKPTSGITVNRVHIDRLVDQASWGCLQHKVYTFQDFGVVIGGHGLHKKGHWPSVFWTNVRSYASSLAAGQTLELRYLPPIP